MISRRLLGQRAAFTSREGGAPASGYGNLNVGDHVGDVSENVAAHRSYLSRWANAPIVWMNQTHSDVVEMVDSTSMSQQKKLPPHATLPIIDADAVIVGPGLATAVMVADCIPVLMATDNGYCAAIHAGRRGIELNIIERSVQKLRATGAQQILAAIGPSICGQHYEVDKTTYQQVCDVVPVAATRTFSGSYALDLRVAARAQLAQQEVVLSWEVGRCSFVDRGLYSYRRDGQTGRMCGVIVSS